MERDDELFHYFGKVESRHTQVEVKTTRGARRNYPMSSLGASLGLYKSKEPFILAFFDGTEPIANSLKRLA
uniref:Uncharacterized protein n=1 Tax=Romanomermis culicivorax TaxID=13658 RepID=A0A915L780_ROMCU